MEVGQGPNWGCSAKGTPASLPSLVCDRQSLVSKKSAHIGRVYYQYAVSVLNTGVCKRKVKHSINI
jgi:hypothetical protein